jgi:hypothetical protein
VGDLNLEIPFRHHNARPYPAEELLLCDKRSVCFQEDHKKIEGARAELTPNTVGEQLPLPQ